MLGVAHSAASDFSALSYPRAPLLNGICHEDHETAIERRYCLKEHVRSYDDSEWEQMLARGMDHFEPNTSPIREKKLKTPVHENTVRSMACSTFSTPSLVGGCGIEDSCSSASDFEDEDILDARLALCNAAPIVNMLNSRKRKRGKTCKPYVPRKRLALNRSSSANSVATSSSLSSTSSALFALHLSLPTSSGSQNPWKCPHCPWIQHTQRLPDFLRHQRSHFVTQSDWPCPNPKCGKGFARKDSLKRHLDNRSTGCKRPPGYMVC